MSGESRRVLEKHEPNPEVSTLLPAFYSLRRLRWTAGLSLSEGKNITLESQTSIVSSGFLSPIYFTFLILISSRESDL